MNRRTRLRLAVILLGSGLAPAGELAGQGLESEAAFLTIPSGARIVALGRAAASLPDVQAAFYNPAAVAWTDRAALGLSSYHGPLGFEAHRASAALRVGALGTVQLAVQAQTFGTFELADESGTLGSVSPGNIIVEAGAARGLGGGVALGVRGKWLASRTYGDASASTVAADVGLLIRPPGVPLRFGLALTDAGAALRQGGEGATPAPLPTRLRLGASASLRLGPVLDLLLAADVAAPPRQWNALSEYAGVGVGYRDAVWVRAGMVRETLIETSTGTTFGLGFRLGPVRLDLAHEAGVNQLGDESHISIEYRP